METTHQNYVNVQQQDTNKSKRRVEQTCNTIADRIDSIKIMLINIVQECFKHKYNVVYKDPFKSEMKFVITACNVVNDLESDKLSIIVKLNSNGVCVTVDLMNDINLRTIKFQADTLYIQSVRALCKL